MDQIEFYKANKGEMRESVVDGENREAIFAWLDFVNRLPERVKSVMIENDCCMVPKGFVVDSKNISEGYSHLALISNKWVKLVNKEIVKAITKNPEVDQGECRLKLVYEHMAYRGYVENTIDKDMVINMNEMITVTFFLSISVKNVTNISFDIPISLNMRSELDQRVKLLESTMLDVKEMLNSVRNSVTGKYLLYG